MDIYKFVDMLRKDGDFTESIISEFEHYMTSGLDSMSMVDLIFSEQPIGRAKTLYVLTLKFIQALQN